MRAPNGQDYFTVGDLIGLIAECEEGYGFDHCSFAFVRPVGTRDSPSKDVEDEDDYYSDEEDYYGYAPLPARLTKLQVAWDS